MPLLVRDDTASTNTIPAYLIIWILFFLACNSMAQPSGRICGSSTRYRLYLCISPLFCFSDGLSILLRLLVTSISLRISPLKASRLAIISRADERHHSKRTLDTSFDDPFPPFLGHESPLPANTPFWPRWLFFLVGAVPAAIQLASFSGVLGIQILGFMFVSSFAIIELVNFLAALNGEHRTIPEILDYMKTEESPIEEQEVRFEAYKLMIRLEWYETALFMTTLVAHSAMMLELTHRIWLPGLLPIHKVYQFHFVKWIYSYYTIAFFLSFFIIVMMCLLLLLLCSRWPFLGHWFFSKQWLWRWICICYCIIFVAIPYEHRFLAGQSALQKREYTLFWVFVMYCFFNSGMSWLCERYPLIAKAFLIDRKPWDLEKIEHVLVGKRTNIEIETGVIHTPAWACLCIFLGTLVVCVLWYTHVYDSTGTVNPSWTLFGWNWVLSLSTTIPPLLTG